MSSVWVASSHPDFNLHTFRPCYFPVCWYIFRSWVEKRHTGIPLIFRCFGHFGFSGDTTMWQTGLPILYNFTNIQNCSQMTCRCSFSELTYDNSDRRNEKEGFETRKENIIYVGIDLHKETHTCSGKQKLLKRDSQKILCTASWTSWKQTDSVLLRSCLRGSSMISWSRSRTKSGRTSSL